MFLSREYHDRDKGAAFRKFQKIFQEFRHTFPGQYLFCLTLLSKNTDS